MNTPKYINPSYQNRKNDELQYCNILDPAPRDPNENVPYLGKRCNLHPNYYNKNKCYFASTQGVTGIVCDQPGDSNNSNYVRGNQFSVSYPFDVKNNINTPVQKKLEEENPMMLYDSNNFYPYPTWKYGINKNPNFLTYPLNNSFTKEGIPTYKFPYKIVNNITEGFNNMSFNHLNKFILIITLIIIFMVVYYTI